MSKSKQIYRLSDAATQYVVQSLSDRLDKLEGWRGTPEFHSNVSLNSNTITELGQGSNTTDAAVRSELTGLNPTFDSLVLNSGGLQTTGPIKFVDSNGTIIHQFGA